jgi:DNA-binding NarL/FixJ family response regulator
MLFRSLQVAIVDDHSFFRKILKNYLAEQQNLNVTISASSIPDLLQKLRTQSVEIVVMDLFMPGLHSKEAVDVIHDEYPDLKMLVLSMCCDIALISDLLDSGIHGYISKSDEPEDLIKAIQAAAEDRIFHNNIFTEALYWNKQSKIKAPPNKPVASLNERDKRVLQLLWEEKSNKEIADELFLGIRSVEKIRQDMKEKIGAKSTIGLLKYAIDNRIVSTSLRSSGLVK